MSAVKQTGAGPAAAKAGPEPDAKNDLESLPVPEVEKRLSSSPDGLSQAEAEKRLARYRANEIADKKDNLLLKLLTSRADDDDTIDLAVLAGLDSDRVQLAAYRILDPVERQDASLVRLPARRGPFRSR